MSPEQARGNAVDRRADVWAFGCCLYEALTGRQAFGGESEADRLAAVLERDPDWRALPAQTPGRGSATCCAAACSATRSAACVTSATRGSRSRTRWPSPWRQRSLVLSTRGRRWLRRPAVGPGGRPGPVWPPWPLFQALAGAPRRRAPRRRASSSPCHRRRPSTWASARRSPSRRTAVFSSTWPTTRSSVLPPAHPSSTGAPWTSSRRGPSPARKAPPGRSSPPTASGSASWRRAPSGRSPSPAAPP